MSRTTMLIGLGLGSCSLYVFGITAAYPLAVGLQYPGASWAILAGFTPAVGLLHAALYGLLTLAYLLALAVALHVKHATPMVYIVLVGGWLACAIALIGAYPGDSTDVFDYLFRGRMLAEYGASPLALAPSALANRPFYAFVHWTDSVDTYGPLWEYASWAVAAIVGWGAPVAGAASISAYITGYRLFAIVCSGASAALIARIVQRHTPGLVPAALLAWLWNPLLLTATALGAHNDLPMLVLVLLALLAFQDKHWMLGLIALGLAAHVKLTALLILPLLLLQLVRQSGWRQAMRSVSGAALILVPISWLLYAPLGGWATLPRMLEERVRLLANSLAYIAYWLLQQAGWREVDAWQVSSRTATLLFGLVALPLLWQFWRAVLATAAAEDARLWRAASNLTLRYIAVGSFWFQHWYVAWALVTAVLLPASRLARVTLPLCCLLALWLHLLIDFSFASRAIQLPQSGHQLAVQSMSVATGTLLALVWLARTSWNRRQKQARP